MCNSLLKISLLLIFVVNGANGIETFDSLGNTAQIFVFGGIIMFTIIRHIVMATEIPVPHSVFVILIGIGLGIGGMYNTWMHNVCVAAERIIQYIARLYVPIIIFSTGFCIDVHAFLKSLSQILIISIPVTILTATLCGMIMSLVLNVNLKSVEALLFGALLVGIYPTEIMGYLKEGNINTKHVSVLLEGETLVATVCSIYLKEEFIINLGGWTVYWYQFLMGFVRSISLGIPTGLLFAYFGAWLMKKSYNSVSLMLLTMIMCYTSYYFDSVIANSGTCGVMIAAIIMGIERTTLPATMEASVTDMWKVITFIANGLVFLLCGVTTPKVLGGIFKLEDYIVVFVTYLMVNMSRFTSFLLFSPILSRIGYGMSFQNMLICVWGGLINPLNLGYAMFLMSLFSEETYKFRLFYLHTFGVFLLVLLINGSSIQLLLNSMKLLELSPTRRVNMNNCIKYIAQRREKTIAILKMDRFLSDANWPLVADKTTMKDPYKKKQNETDCEDEEDNFLENRFTVCPECKKNVPKEPTPKEMKEMIREAKLRVLKFKKMFYSKQCENGMLSKEGKRILTQAVEIAMDTEQATIELDGLYQMFHNQSFFNRCCRNRLLYFTKAQYMPTRPPRKHWRYICYTIIRHSATVALINITVILSIGLAIYYFLKTPTLPSTEAYVCIHLGTIIFLIFLGEFWLKIFGYSWIYICQHGFKSYFRSCFNILDFIVLCACFVNCVIDFLSLFHAYPNQFETMGILKGIRFLRVISLIKLLIICRQTYPRIIKYMDMRFDKHQAMAYELAKNYIAGEEELLENLYHIIDNEKIREYIRQDIEQDRLAVTKVLGIATKEKPWVAVTVKTQQVMRAVLTSIKEDINELKVSGWADDVEYSKLLKSLTERHKSISSLKTINPPTSKFIFKEVFWMGDDNEVINFLYANVNTRNFNIGEKVFIEGDIADGIYILIRGIFVISCNIQKSVLENLAEVGALPIIDYLSCTKLEQNVMVDYLVSGNCIGELGTLTRRPYHCEIRAETHCQAYFLRREILTKAMEMDPDPINGLECRIWKTVAFRIAISIMMSSSTYHSQPKETIKYILERSFVPNLRNYKLFIVNDKMEDIVLIEGIAVDANTRDIFTGPCYIPRAVQKLMLPKNNLYKKIEIHTKLLIIPAKDYDKYEIMLHDEDTCELVHDDPTKCLQHLIREQLVKHNQDKKRLLSFQKKEVQRGKSLSSVSTKNTRKSRITFVFIMTCDEKNYSFNIL